MKRQTLAWLLVAWSSSAPLAAYAAPPLDKLRPRMLTELTDKQARRVCEAANDVQDLCAIAGRSQETIEACEDTVELCRAQESEPQIDCSLAHFDFGPDCVATVDQYLTCVEAWNGALECSGINQTWSSPPDVQPGCFPLLEACPHLISEYGDPATYVPPCDAENSPVRVDEDDDVRGLDSCRPVPSRLVVLGDSIAACTFPVDPDGSTACAPELIAEYLREHYAPELSYEHHAFPGARTAHGILQAQQVTPGPGHVFVWVYMGGNDIGPCSSSDDAALTACADRVIAQLHAEWEPILAYFSDAALFPDGATFLLNTQYPLGDECAAPGATGRPMSEVAALKLLEYNQRLFIDRALERADTIAVDQYPDWLGHGINADNARCPHCYRDDNTTWLSDRLHPSATGQRHIAEKWYVAIDATFASCAP